VAKNPSSASSGKHRNATKTVSAILAAAIHGRWIATLRLHTRPSAVHSKQ
jgi:hypothetical protein